MAMQVMYGMLFGIYTTTTNLLDSCVLGVSAGTQEQCVNHMNLTSELHEHLRLPTSFHQVSKSYGCQFW